MSHALRTCEVMGQVGEDFFGFETKYFQHCRQIAVSRTTTDQKRALMWKLTEDMSQQQAAERIGWSRDAVAKYGMLSKLSEEAWLIVTDSVTGVTNNVTGGNNALEEDNKDSVTKSPFSENLLRNILDLSAGQQLTLCRKLARGKDKKGRAEIAKSQSEEFHHHGILDSR